MSDHVQREAVASLLLEYVNKDDITKVEGHLNQFKDDSQWRNIIRCEFPIQALMTDTLQYDLSLPRLLSYEIGTLSPFHYAALRGLNDILMNFIDHDVPVDVILKSGTTALHLAAFGGKHDCVKMLLEIYKAELNKQDRYGWTALHYASTEGQYNVVKLLIDSGINKTTRDQDGTSAAFRAQINGYEDIVKLLAVDKSDLLTVQHPKDGLLSSPDDIYSQIGTKHTTIPRNRKTQSSSSVKPVLRKTESMPSNIKDNRRSVIRRLIQQELETMEQGSSCYLEPNACVTGPSGSEPSEEEARALRSIGPNTLKGVLREEIGKFTKQLFSSQFSADGTIPEESPYSFGRAPKPPGHSEYEDIYETVKMIPQPTSGEGHQEDNYEDNDSDDAPPPPLPPRVISLNDDDDEPKDMLQLSIPTDSAVLTESLSRIAELIGADWKKLAYQLPLEKTPSKTQQRVEKIEKKHPGDVKRQATAALGEWRINKGSSADVDCLIIALRNCGLNQLIDEVDRATQEFTA